MSTSNIQESKLGSQLISNPAAAQVQQPSAMIHKRGSSDSPTTPKEEDAIDLERQPSRSTEEEGNVSMSIMYIDTYAHAGQIYERAPDAFGDESGAAIHYKTMEWWHCGIRMFLQLELEGSKRSQADNYL